WASVTIDGQAQGTTPLFDLELAPGSHVIRFEHALLQRTEVRRVHLAPGESARLIVDLRNESEPLAGDP
ncbi:MAG: PEGA domain-containing protein, partial [Sandaracinaceae bacterium]|nr:PEGA domain-containing protein [Sandaracinaceae bacterium]